MEAAAEEPEQEQTSDVLIALALVSSREEGFSLTASSGGAGRERTASASLVLSRSCCADSDVTAEVPAVGTGSYPFFILCRSLRLNRSGRNAHSQLVVSALGVYTVALPRSGS